MLRGHFDRRPTLPRHIIPPPKFSGVQALPTLGLVCVRRGLRDPLKREPSGMPPQAIPVLAPQAARHCSHLAAETGTPSCTTWKGLTALESFDGPSPGETRVPLLWEKGRLQRPKSLKVPEQSPAWPGDVTSLCTDLQAKLLRGHGRGAQHHGGTLCPCHGQVQILKIPARDFRQNNYRFSPGFCASWDQFSFPLHGNKGTYLKMKFDISVEARDCHKNIHGKRRDKNFKILVLYKLCVSAQSI